MPDVETAYLEAYAAAIEIIGQMMRERVDPHSFQFEIFDAEGRFLMELPFADVVRSRPRAMLPPGRHAIFPHIQRGRKLNADLRGELEKTRSLLESSRAILARAAKTTAS